VILCHRYVFWAWGDMLSPAVRLCTGSGDG
jgi:hypothetical protein